MAVTRLVMHVITCDWPGCPRQYRGEAGEYLPRVRMLARKAGWVGTGFTDDFCPVHRPLD